MAEASAAGIDPVCWGDHVSFVAGLEFDGLTQATTLSMLHPTLPVHTACTSCRAAGWASA